MPNITEILSFFSLSDIESKIYLAVLAMEKPVVAQIAKKVGLNRTAAYHHINGLLEKGFLKQTRKGKVVTLVATKPNELAEKFDRLTTDFKSLVPQLESLQKISSETPLIEITESKQGYRKLYDELSSLPEGSTFRVIEGEESMLKEIKIQSDMELNAFFSRLNQRRIITRALFTNESLDVILKGMTKKNIEVFKKRNWELRILPASQLSFQQLIFLYQDKTVFVFPNVSLVMRIQHKDIADTVRALFEGLYGFAKPATFS